MTIVLDASTLVAALIDTGAHGRWAEALLASESLLAPHLLPVETTNILRRAVLAGNVTQDAAALAHADISSLRIVYFAYEPFAQRVWELRFNVTSYDAWYVALAEETEAPLATLDVRLAQAVGPKCAFLRPPA